MGYVMRSNLNFNQFALLNNIHHILDLYFVQLVHACQLWDVLSNKEVVDIVASAPARSSAARALVETAVRSWRHKYPTSKVDDCAVVCLFLDSDTHSMSAAGNTQSKEQLTPVAEVNCVTEKEEEPSCPTGLDRSGTVRTEQAVHPEGSNEDALEEMNSEKLHDWSALEGVSRVNTLLTLPRFVPGEDDKKAIK